ncbi:MAG: YIP1 family protein [Verrucomicrobia bacterium]|nr:YIP1 family protein [Verrucomicrobiota bacterium]
MIKVLLLIFDPIATWERIDKAQRGVVFLFFLYLLPLLSITLAGEAYGILQWGKEQGMLHQLTKVPEAVLVFYEVGQLVLSLIVVFVGARLIQTIGESFHGRTTYTQAFTVVAYALGPLFLVRLLDAIPAMNAWVTWGIGMTLTFAVFYHGLPRILKPDPAHALGLYFLGILVLVVITGLARFVATLLLQQKMRFPF